MVFDFLKKQKLKAGDHSWVETAVRVATEHDIQRELFVALILNESSGNPFATRWERRFYIRYISQKSLEQLVPHHRSLDNYEEQLLRISLAYSWGLCQIMGIVAVENGFRGQQMWELLDVETNLKLGARIYAGYRDGILKTQKGLPAGELVKRALLRYNGGGDLEYPDRVFKRLGAATELVKQCRG